MRRKSRYAKLLRELCFLIHWTKRQHLKETLYSMATFFPLENLE
jgi:hypothetical protein